MIELVIFDLDGTLVDSELDFDRIRREIGMDGGSVLEYIETADEAERERANAIVRKHEQRAAETCVLADGAVEILDSLRRSGVKVGLLTRNSRMSVETVMRRYGLEFDAVVAREDAAPKPSPEPVLLICRDLGIPPSATMVVGDYVFDVEAGRRAGAVSVFLKTPKHGHIETESDYEVRTLAEVAGIVAELGK